MDNFVSKIIRLKFNQKQKSERSKANQSYSNLLVEEIYVTSPSVNLRFLGANKCRIKDEGRPPYTCIYFERRCSTLRCDEAWQIHAVRARASRGSTRFCGLDVVGRDRTRSNELMPRSGGEGRACARALNPDTRVESRSNRRKRGQTRAKPWFAKEEANCMYIRGLEDTYAG